MTRRQFVTTVVAGAGIVPVAALFATKSQPMTSQTPPPAEPFPVAKTDAEWQNMLTPKQYAVLRRHDTEHPGTSPLLQEHRTGVFVCAGCGQELFASETKFESGSGWPSFFDAREGAVAITEDRTLGMRRVEIRCSRCGGHLGHVFPDGPLPTGRRYCTNGAALTFKPRE